MSDSKDLTITVRQALELKSAAQAEINNIINSLEKRVGLCVEIDDADTNAVSSRTKIVLSYTHRGF